MPVEITVVRSADPTTIEVERTTNTIEINRSGVAGPEGPEGPDGPAGAPGPPGPNSVSTSTASTITGLLKGAGGFVAQAIAGTDYSTYDSSDFATDFAASDLANLGTRDYADLQNLPTLYTHSDFVSDFAASDLADLATRSYNDLQNLPTLYTSADFNTDFAAKDTDDLAEGSTNLYTQWIRTAVSGSNYLVPDTSTDLFAVQSLATLDEWISISGAPTAWFGARNDEGLNYFVQEARGTSFVPLGAVFLSLRVQGTGASPAPVTNGDWIGGLAFGAYGSSGYTVSSLGGWLVPGLWGKVSDTGAIGATFPFTCWIGSAVGAATAPLAVADTGITFIRGATGSVYSINSQDITLDKIAGAYFVNGGAAIAVGTQVAMRIPYNCTIQGYSINGNPAGTTGDAVVDVWVDTTANYPPTDADSITASAPPTISSDNAIYSTTLTGWTVNLTAGDWLIFNVDSATLTEITVALYGVKR